MRLHSVVALVVATGGIPSAAFVNFLAAPLLHLAGFTPVGIQAGSFAAIAQSAAMGGSGAATIKAAVSGAAASALYVVWMDSSARSEDSGQKDHTESSQGSAGENGDGGHGEKV